MQPHYVGRFAPSPTGPLHFGSLVAALASYVDAKHHGGQWLVRIEDIDEPRSVPGAAEEILRALRTYGLQWDGDVVVQSQRKPLYEAALQRLRDDGHVFACTCSRKQLECAPLNVNGERLYPGTCRTRLMPPANGEQFAWRLRVPDATIHWQDRREGAQSQSLAHEIGDFIVKRADGFFAYQLAVVVDDAAQGITHIVRGADLLSNTARQIHLQQLLGYATPHYLHVPLIVNDKGEKLSKQTQAPALSLDEKDIMPTLVRAWEALGQEAISAATLNEFLCESIKAWRVKRLPLPSRIDG